jgi:hypothetical protein
MGAPTIKVALSLADKIRAQSKCLDQAVRNWLVNMDNMDNIFKIAAPSTAIIIAISAWWVLMYVWSAAYKNTSLAKDNKH